MEGEARLKKLTNLFSSFVSPQRDYEGEYDPCQKTN